MAVVEPGYLGDVELFEGGRQSLRMFQVECHLEIPFLVGSQKLVDHQLGIRTDVEFLNPLSLAMLSLAMSALYSALLFVALEPQCIACCIKSPSGEVKTRPMPASLTLLEPSTESVHLELSVLLN